ncbi:hypothetical protein BTUL_0119g00090 [Botrytis tulipae]|uniref:Uncharacterized protein n=1 Tax=Botrytis tulipae TaxID=87230 RepID=A0A4Z1EIR1_9HELO|nr:hypothetical protein BTUL_0119g00090 [Botrytis tulipae]
MLLNVEMRSAAPRRENHRYRNANPCRRMHACLETSLITKRKEKKKISQLLRRSRRIPRSPALEKSSTARTSNAPIATLGAGRALAFAGGSATGVVSGAATSNVPHASFAHLLFAGALTFEFFVEGEGCFLGGGENVAGAAAAAAEFR